MGQVLTTPSFCPCEHLTCIRNSFIQWRLALRLVFWTYPHPHGMHTAWVVILLQLLKLGNYTSKNTSYRWKIKIETNSMEFALKCFVDFMFILGNDSRMMIISGIDCTTHSHEIQLVWRLPWSFACFWGGNASLHLLHSTPKRHCCAIGELWHLTEFCTLSATSQSQKSVCNFEKMN